MTNETKTQSLVTLPKEVAEAIESLLKKQFNKFGIIAGLETERGDHPEFDVLNQHFNSLDVESERHAFTLAIALVNGYQVENTPEERVKELYLAADRAALQANDESFTRVYYNGKLRGISETLDLLGIRIEGVNVQ